MTLIYRRLQVNDIPQLIEIRIRQLKEEGTKEACDLRPALSAYYLKHLKDDSFVSYLAEEEGKMIATSGIAFVEKPPYYGCENGLIGLLSNMYTDPAYRRQGIATELLNRIVKEAKDRGCGVIQITASDMGVKLYSGYGFVHNGNFMQYVL